MGKKNKDYVKEIDLLYEIILSKGKGNLTKKAEKYLTLIAYETFHVFDGKFEYKDIDERNDCLYEGILQLLSNWRKFNEKKFKKVLPYYTEIFKRAVFNGYNKLKNKKSYHKKSPVLISIDSSNNGKGLHNMF